MEQNYHPKYTTFEAVEDFTSEVDDSVLRRRQFLLAPLDAAMKLRYGVRNPTELSDRCTQLGAHEELVSGVLGTRSLALLAGNSVIGKTPLLYQLAVCVAAGEPFLGHPVQKGRVLYCDFENGVGHVLGMLGRLARHLGIDLNGLHDDLILWNFNDLPADQRWHDPLRLIPECQPALVIIDPLGIFRPEAENENKIANECVRQLRGIIGTVGCTILVAHHLRKPSNKPDERPDPLETATLGDWFHQVRGASALINGSDIRLAIDTCAKSDVIIRGMTRVRGEIPPLFLNRSRDDEGEPLGYFPVTGSALLPVEQQERFNSLPPEFRFKDAKQTYGKGDQATNDFLKKCLDLKIVEKTGHGYRKVPD